MRLTKTVIEVSAAIPAGWRLMALAHHADGQWYCCLRTTDEAGSGCAIQYAQSAQLALDGAIGKALDDDQR